MNNGVKLIDGADYELRDNQLQTYTSGIYNKEEDVFYIECEKPYCIPRKMIEAYWLTNSAHNFKNAARKIRSGEIQ